MIVASRLVSLCSLQAASPPDFETEVGPLLLARCVECHNTNDASGGLDLTDRSKLLQGGDSGPAITDSDTARSLLIQRTSGGEMPPAKNGKPQPLSPDEINVLKVWVEQGAVWPAGRKLDLFERTTSKRGGRDWWSFQPIHASSPHELFTDSSFISSTSVDMFIDARLRRAEFKPADAAPRRELLRRLSYDLTGLPASADELDAFEADTRPDAYERIVDRMLAMPQFGERWGRHWLDVARFAETNGYERDAVKAHAWRYRDWVIQALNDDMPYDRFITYQLAGDEVPERSEETVVATGFLRLGTWDDEPNDPLEYQYDRLEDFVHATTTAFLGLTVKCARCHDHKFDPIPQADYYRIAAAFWPGPIAHRKREWNGGPTKEELGFDVLGWTDLSAAPAELHLLKKGNVHRPAEAIAAGSLSVAGSLREFAPPEAGSKTTRRRLQLAQWITDRSNPLTDRVLVNRVWLHLMGSGLVKTPDNFGYQGTKPTHPELLDWLATDFQRNERQIKPLIRKLVLTDTYRRSSLHPEADSLSQRDPNNDLRWRGERRRMDAESLRDALLTAGGRLDLRLGGPSFYAPISTEALEGLSRKSSVYHASPPHETARRSVYMFAQRSLAVPLMTVFDCCDTTAPVGKRDVTIVAPQALMLMNSEDAATEARAAAERILQSGTETNLRIVTAWRQILNRNPSAQEMETARTYLDRAGRGDGNSLQAWSAACHVLMNTNEFIYVD
ncbi:MAG: PSD1 and planctomycete cytochrome C domain-containing protein [Pirellulales bacterium]